jgi:uncharacterized protein (DUF58 family)
VKAAAGGAVLPFWRRILWGLIWPRRYERIQPTISGLVLIGLSLGIGTAAYNSASNILFIALALLLACLILSGVLAWLNLRGVEWTLEVRPPLIAGQEAPVGLVLRNEKHFIPTYALWFDFAATPVSLGEPAKPESTITGRGIDVWATLRKAEALVTRGSVHLKTRLDPKGGARLEWLFTPPARGILRVEVLGVGSLFPFGFLRKMTGKTQQREVPVWPAPVEYRRFGGAAARRPAGALRQARSGNEGEMFALRQYEHGDSHRLIHWKASARSGSLLIRQFSSMNSDACSLWLRTDAAVWTRPEQFELLLSFAATLAQDLFRAGRLQSTSIDADIPVPARRVADLESFLDRLSEARPLALSAPSSTGPHVHGRALLNLLTFEPDGARGVAAYINGTKTAAT